MAKAWTTSKPSAFLVHDDQWRISDALWEQVVPLLPALPSHPLGCQNPRVADPKAIDAIFFILRTRCQWGRWMPWASAHTPRPTAASRS